MLSGIADFVVLYFVCLRVCLCAAKVMRTSNNATVVISADTRNAVKVASTTATSRRQVIVMSLI